MVVFQHRVVALLVWFLSREVKWALYFICFNYPHEFNEVAAPINFEAVALQLLDWWSDRLVGEAVGRALDEPNDRYRVMADEFLVRSLVAEFVVERNTVGEAVPPAAAINKYLRLWAQRPCPPRVQGRLAKLTWHRNARRKFGQIMRSEWLLEIATFRLARPLSPPETSHVVLFSERVL